jgi:hypothetical protein
MGQVILGPVSIARKTKLLIVCASLDDARIRGEKWAASGAQVTALDIPKHRAAACA